MPFSKAAVHGIYMLCYLSRQDAGDVTSAATLAGATDVPPEHARKILMRLCAAGIVTSVNGRSGGYASTRGMEDTSIQEVLDAISPSSDDHGLTPRACVAAPEEPCSVQPGLASLREQMRKFLAGKTLASIAGKACLKRTETSGITGCGGCREPVDEAVAVLS